MVMLDSTLNQPNGLVGTPDGKHLYVAEAKANRILRYDIQTDLIHYRIKIRLYSKNACAWGTMMSFKANCLETKEL